MISSFFLRINTGSVEVPGAWCETSEKLKFNSTGSDEEGAGTRASPYVPTSLIFFIFSLCFISTFFLLVHSLSLHASIVHN
jgi:hypothetical protein